MRLRVGCDVRKPDGGACSHRADIHVCNEGRFKHIKLHAKEREVHS